MKTYRRGKLLRLVQAGKLMILENGDAHDINLDDPTSIVSVDDFSTRTGVALELTNGMIILKKAKTDPPNKSITFIPKASVQKFVKPTVSKFIHGQHVKTSNETGVFLRAYTKQGIKYDVISISTSTGSIEQVYPESEVEAEP